MSELKRLLHQEAISVSFKPPDLDVITDAGGRRLRRRRFTTAFGTALAVLAIVATGTAVVLYNRPSPPNPPVVSVPPVPASWSVDTVIHDGSTRTIDVGHRVNAFVRTAAGFVVASQDDIYAVTAAGVQPIGRLATTEYLEERIFIVNGDGTRVAWLDFSTPGLATVRTYDPETGTTRDVLELARLYLGVSLFALDGRTAYLTDKGVVYALDLDTGERRAINTSSTVVERVFGAANGMLAFEIRGDGEEQVIYAGRSVDEAHVVHTNRTEGLAAGTDGMALSPTGDWLSAVWFEFDGTGDGPDELKQLVPVVVNTVTGEQIDLTAAVPSAVTVPVWWLGDSVVEVISVDVAAYSAEIFACQVPAATCERVGATGPTSPQTLLVLPDGRWAEVDAPTP